LPVWRTLLLCPPPQGKRSGSGDEGGNEKNEFSSSELIFIRSRSPLITHSQSITLPTTFSTATLATMSFLDKMKKASKSVVDAGAKQMLKVRSVK
jgi:hypothetical protein